MSYPCHYCDKTYKYGDSCERHERDKHGTNFERAQAKLQAIMRREAARAQRTRTRHKVLQAKVVETALDWYRFRDGTDEDDLTVVVPLVRACAALEKFETTDVR